MLREVSRPAVHPDQTRLILRDLRATLADFRRRHGFGRGISAVQIGEPVRIIYIEFEGAAYSLVNPQWESLSRDKLRLWDDCFSFPDLLVYLERSRAVSLSYHDPDGNLRRLEAAGALAELLQHEMDHLDGVLAVDRALDRMSLATRSEYERRYKQASRL